MPSFCQLAEQPVVCLIDRCPGEEVDGGALEGIQLVVDDEELGLLILLDRLQWVGRDDYHRIHVPALQQAKTFGFVAPRADHGHRLTRVLGPVDHRLTEDVVLGSDQVHVERADRLIADPEEQQDQERAEYQRREEAGLADNLDDLLADEGSGPDDRCDPTLHRSSPSMARHLLPARPA